MKTEAYELAISRQYTIYEGSQYTSDLRCTILDDLKGIYYTSFNNVHFHQYADHVGTVHDEGRQTHIQLITQYFRPHYVNMKIIHFPKHPIN